MILRAQFVTAALLFLGLSVVECNNELKRNLRRTTDQKASTEEDRKLTPYGYSTGFGASTVRQSSYNRGYASLMGIRSNTRPPQPQPQPQVGYQASSLHRTHKSAKTSKATKDAKDTKAGKNGKAGKAHHTTHTGSLRPYPHYTNQNPQSSRTGRVRTCNSFLCSMRWTTIPGQPIFLNTPNIPVIIIEPNSNITVQNSSSIEAQINATIINGQNLEGGGETGSESFPLDPTTEPTRRPTHTPTLKPTPNPTGSPTLRPTGNPTIQPTKNPTGSPTKKPTATPTTSPTKKPTAIPTRSPTRNPTRSPTRNPTRSPTRKPTNQPTVTP
eukprot:CAMPEP_0172412202 /NCGR_PEP_ID=MMETSP1061-20121228/77784_1 /TAXON_ID=37318 /ORGANISM="Pseudo-nitzschia pungens, Strain cf. pungens" /LENGTH=326 /DNA_ID=CAMNT_0013148429 /DNA_START=68 /DNA_END=1048 /DNA_ORIENTATION=+